MTYKLKVRQRNIYDAVDGFELLLHAVEENRDIPLAEGASYAAMKTAAIAIFKATIVWTDSIMESTVVSNLATWA